MNEEEKKKLWEEGEKRMKSIGYAVRDVISPQIKEHGESYDDYLKDISATAGLLLGGTIALWSVDFVIFVKPLAVLGFVSLSITVVFSFLLRRRAVIRPIPYIQYLKKLSRWLTDHSNRIVLFSRKELSIDDYMKEKKEFESNYPTMRAGGRFNELEQEEAGIIERMAKWYSEVNILTAFFLLGIGLVLVSVLLPQICT